MAAMSRGTRPAAKPQLRVAKRVKGGTKSSKNHTFESFAQRIAKLKIEPVRRGRSTIIDDAELDATFSYFKDTLVEWRDINLSEIFSTFARRVAPLCDSLPQVLHYEDRIFDLLVENIEKGDKNSEEPLLKLLANFAHDLGVRFEKHFERAVRTVAHLAATHADVEVIEWSFTCLAWLFKYLSRLLVPDLRPVFDLMVPLLGKARQKLFVMRFAAESLSFLVRKAGAAYHRDQSPLRTIIRHASELLKDSKGTVQDIDFQQGLMTLFADSIKGVQRGLHSSAVAIVKEMLLCTYDEDYANLQSPPLEFVLKGVITSVIHHSDAENFQPLLEAFIETIKSKTSDKRYLGLSSRLLFVVCSVRKGSRVAQWPPVLETINFLVTSIDESSTIEATHTQELLSALAVVFQYCPIDAAIPHTQLLEKLSKEPLEKFFLSFCNTFAELGPERFNTLLLSYFKRSVYYSSSFDRALIVSRFVVQKAQEYGDELCVILPSLYEHSIVPKDSLQVPLAWQKIISNQLQQLTTSNSTQDDSQRILYECNAFIDAIGSFIISTEQKQAISKCLFEALTRSLKDGDNKLAPNTRTFAIGNGFQQIVRDDNLQESLLQLWPALCKAASATGDSSLSFWKALLFLAESNKSSLDLLSGEHIGPLKQGLLRCLGSPSHELRLVALGLFEILASDTEERRNAIATASIIEQTPVNLETQRSISIRIGQLAKLYPSIAADEHLGEAVPTFLFGLLHVRLASIWDDVCSALKAICETKEGESYVLKVAFEWINQSSSNDESAFVAKEAPAPPRYVSTFECTNVMQLEHTIRKSEAMLDDVEEQLQARFERDHSNVQFLNDFSRTQALRVLNELPAVAEKRSRVLVPVLLDWVSGQQATDMSDDDNTVGEASDKFSRWSRKDQKSMLTLFSKFTNPKVLYRATDVYQALLALLGNGDADVQKAALKALLTWKQPAIVEYQENLFNLLDDSRFRDEVSVFLDAGSDQSAIKEHHRDILLPVLLRLLYGKVISGKRGLDVKRKAVFQALTRFEDRTIDQFLEIALGPLSGIHILRDQALDESVLQGDLLAPRKQVGMINMVEDMLGALKTTIRPFVASLVDPILFCLINAARALAKSNSASESEFDNSQASIFRAIRQRSLHALNILFGSYPEFEWAPYALVVVGELVTPRLQQFPVETAQSVSGLLRLFSAWSKSTATARFLVDFDQDILTKITECLDVASAKDEVKRFILDDILRELISLVAKDEQDPTEVKIRKNSIQSNILQPYANSVLIHVGALLRKSPSKEVLESGVHTIAELAPHVVGSSESRSMIEISSFLLRQPSQRVNAGTKLGLLKILHEFIPRCQSTDITELFDTIFEGVCPLFSYLKDQSARVLLCNIVDDLSVYRDQLSAVAKLCHGLNAYSTSRLDEPDFDRRSAAFGQITSDVYYSLAQWKLMVYNMLFFIKDEAELSIRVNASLALRHFIKTSTQDQDSKDFISTALLPGIRFGVREPSELVRVEFLAVLAQLVETYRDWAPVSDLHILVSEDEEASFYSNILHIQNHRRLRALRRLALNSPHLQSANIYHIFVPLLEHFVFNKADDDNANALAGETGKTITTLCLGLEWPQFRSLLRRYIGYLSSKEDLQKTVIKLLSGLLDGLNQAGRFKYVSLTPPETVTPSQPADGADEVNGPDHMEVDEHPPALAKTLPEQGKLTKDIVDNILPDLQNFLRKKDESTVSLRVPVAIAVCKALLILPSIEIEARLPGVLLDMSHILRSKDQGSRDMARNTLAEIATFTGPPYFGFILRALRIALSRGYQLHVLSFTLHKIIVELSEQLKPGDLDYCVADIVDVIMDDIFGVTGQEKDAEEYISKMKEVKSSKSFDTMDLIARSTTPASLINLVLPIKTLLQEKLNARMVQKIDELMRRIGLGVLQNPTVNDRDILVFSYELIHEVYKSNNRTEKVEHVDPRNRKFLINMKGAAKSGARQSTASYSHKLIRFGLDILRTVLRKHEELRTPQNLSGFLPIIGDALIANHEELQTSAIRLLSTIITVPMKELDESCPVYVAEAVRSIKGATSSNSEIAQASLKLITSMLRERPNVQVREQDLSHLLKRILPDIDEPDRQGVTFGFLKAVMMRKIVITEVYEVMDKVAAMMITNQTQSARQIARSTYFNFLMEYPQAKNRFKKQLEFLLKNLRYDYVEGRQSVMEALSLVLNKVGEKILEENLDMMFIPLVHSMANDDSADCRTMAGALVKTIFERANAQQLKSFTTDLKEWITQDEDPGLKRLGIQCWGLYLEVADAKPKELEFVMEQLRNTLDICLERRDEDDWELIYYALTVFSKLTKPWPDYTLSSESMWTLVRSCVSYPHAWVKLTAAKLIGIYFADLSSANSETGLESAPLKGSHGLQLNEEVMVQLTHAFLRNLEAPNASEDLCIQSVRNLAFLARCEAVNLIKWNWKKVDDDEDVQDDTLAGEANGAEGTNGDASNDEWDGFSSGSESPQPKKTKAAIPTAIHRLVTRLSGIIRRETKIMKLSSLYPKSATATLLETLVTKLPIPALESSLPHLLTTLSTLTDPATTIPRSTEAAFNDTYRVIIDKSREIMNTLQKRMGTQDYLKVMGDVQKGVKQRREERRQKRKIEAVTMPEKFGKEKKRRNEVKKVKRKEKNAAYQGKRRGW
ncbi:U3 snoRNP protein [Paraconiothyrium brasiliense]|uniref:U3 snoRNP protein n=1 Tax=Paraconiothyrium brasiliense TaxID=300254 RepID=A0ABR3QSG3_9PLEO